MMIRILVFMSVMLFAVSNNFAQDLGKQFSQSITITVNNPLNEERENEMIFIPTAKLGKAFNSNAFVVMEGQKEIPSQYNNQDKDYPGIVFVLEKLERKELKKIDIRYNAKGIVKRSYPKRTQAELSHKVGGVFVNREYVGGKFQNVDFLRVPPEHKDHSWFIRYEGPGWESDKVGYRFYLDARNATDVFGKTTSDMVLQNVGLDGFDSYHEKQSWGMDVMKVGKSLGLGTPGMYKNDKAIRIEKTDSVDCRVVENGFVFSSITTNYYGWNVDDRTGNVKSRLTIHAGTRLTHQFIAATGNLDNLCTGIVKDKEAVLIASKGDKEHFGYIATYGKQSLNSDNLGLAIFFNANDYKAFQEDDASNIVTFNTNTNIDYYFLAAWEGELNGIKNEEQFRKYLQHVSQRLASPVDVIVKMTK